MAKLLLTSKWDGRKQPPPSFRKKELHGSNKQKDQPPVLTTIHEENCRNHYRVSGLVQWAFWFGAFELKGLIMKNQKGFTLIEVMVAVAVVAILTVLAYPSYLEYLKKGRRSSAQIFMMAIANQQSQYLLDARNYAVSGDATAITALGLTVPPDVTPYYDLKVNPAVVTNPPSYTITATPKGTQTSDGIITLDHQSAKTRNGQPGW